MADTGVRATAKRRAKAAAGGRKGQSLRGTALPFNRSLAHLCWQIGLSHASTAWVVGRSVSEVRHEWSILMGLPLEEDPTPESIEAQTAEIRSEWSPETYRLAEAGIRHDSSTKHRGDKRCATTNSRATGKRKGRLPEWSRPTGLLASR